MVLSNTETQVQSVESFSSKRKALSKNALISPNARFGHFFQKTYYLDLAWTTSSIGLSGITSTSSNLRLSQLQRESLPWKSLPKFQTGWMIGTISV